MALTRRVGVTADPEANSVHCMRCGERWCPVRVLGARGYRLPFQWWRCPNDCNAPGTEPYEWRSDFARDSPTTTTTVTATPIMTTRMPVPTITTPAAISDDDEFLSRRKCSGEVLSFADLEESVSTGVAAMQGQPFWPNGVPLVEPFEIAFHRRPHVHVAYEAHFAEHHYLPGLLPAPVLAVVAYHPDSPDKFVAFGSSIKYPFEVGSYQECRLVVSPEFRGVGLGAAVSEWLAACHVRVGQRFYSMTQNPRVGAARDRSPHWRATSKNGRARSARHKGSDGHVTGVVTYSHEYIGPT